MEYKKIPTEILTEIDVPFEAFLKSRGLNVA